MAAMQSYIQTSLKSFLEPVTTGNIIQGRLGEPTLTRKLDGKLRITQIAAHSLHGGLRLVLGGRLRRPPWIPDLQWVKPKEVTLEVTTLLMKSL